MWRTQIGERTLQRVEARLFREALASMVDLLEQETDFEEESWEFSTPVFDRLAWPQKLALLADVGSALLKRSVSPPKLTAVNEGTVAALYEHIWQEVQFEVDSDEPDHELKFWRRAILAVFQAEGDDDLPPVNCTDFDDWRVLIDCLRDRILWDDDFNSEDLYVDCEPEKSQYLKRLMRIDEDYFTVIPPDPTVRDLEAARKTLHTLIRASD